jgi:hypothetical protein
MLYPLSYEGGTCRKGGRKPLGTLPFEAADHGTGAGARGFPPLHDACRRDFRALDESGDELLAALLCAQDGKRVHHQGVAEEVLVVTSALPRPGEAVVDASGVRDLALFRPVGLHRPQRVKATVLVSADEGDSVVA